MRFKQLLLIASIVAIFGACKDEFSSAGGGVLPGDEVVSTHTQISDINARSELSDSIKSSNPSSFILGEVRDSKFGISKGDFMTQFSIGQISTGDTNRLKYNDNYYLDSTKLLLKYPQFAWVGDTLANHTISVYELTTLLDQLQTYDSNTKGIEFTNGIEIGSLVFNAKNGKNDSIWEQSNYVDTLFIPITEESGLGQKIFEADSATILNNTRFRELFNGLYVTSSVVNPNSEGSLIRLSPSAYNQELVLYYKRINYDITLGEIIDTTFFEKSFPVNNESVKVNMFDHNYDDSDIEFNDNTSKNLFIQPMGGSLGRMDISQEFKDSWKDSITNVNTDEHLGIAAVDMTFYVDTTATNYRVYPPPSNLSAYYKNKKGELVTPTFVDYSGALSSGIGTGQLVYAVNDNDEIYPSYYKFAFTPGYFEELVNPSSFNQDFVDYTELYITPLNPESNFNRVIVHSSNADEEDVDDDDKMDKTIKKAFLAIKYVKLK